MNTYRSPGWLVGDVDRIVAEMTADYDAHEKGQPAAMSRSRHARLDGYADIKAIITHDGSPGSKIGLIQAIVTAVDIINKREAAGWEVAE